MTWAAISSPTRPAASAPASTAALTLPTSPRTIVVTKAPPIWMVFTTSTLAALHIASVASTRPTQPLVSIKPRACPKLPFPVSAIGMLLKRENVKREDVKREEGFFSRLHVFTFHALPACTFARAFGEASADRLGGGLFRLGHHAAQFVVGAGDDVDADDGPDAAGRLGAGVDGGLHRGDVALHEGGDHAASGLVPPDHFDVGRLEHRVAALHQGDEAFTLQETQ